MIGFADTICATPHGFGPITKPGYGEPEPLKPVNPMDTQENIDICLDCKLPECKPEISACPHYGRSANAKCKRRKKIEERDSKILGLINAGWVNIDAICEEVGISRVEYNEARKRLKKRGEI